MTKTYSLGVILGLLLLAGGMVGTYLMGYRDGTRKLNAIQAQDEQVIEALKHGYDKKIFDAQQQHDQQVRDILNNTYSGS
jgi:hypothetical protein